MSPEQFVARVAAQHAVADEHLELILEPHPVFERTAPGQFINVSVSGEDRFDPLLRRPFSLYRRFPDGSHSLLYRTVGRGTRILSRLQKGDSLTSSVRWAKVFPCCPAAVRCWSAVVSACLRSSFGPKKCSSIKAMLGRFSGLTRRGWPFVTTIWPSSAFKWILRRWTAV